MQISITVHLEDAKFLVDALGCLQSQSIDLEICMRKDFLKDAATINADSLEAYADSHIQGYRATYLIDTLLSLIEQAEKSNEIARSA